jgi:hypothetical protein
MNSCRQLATASIGILWILSSASVGLAQNNSPFFVTGDLDPTLYLEQLGSGAVPFYSWYMLGNELNYFVADGTGNTVPFIIQAGAPTGSFYLVAGGHVGMGTTSPQTKLHLAGAAPNTLRFETQDGTGKTLRSWDIQTDSNNFGVADFTSGKTPLLIRKASPTNSLVIDTGGSIGLGTSAPTALGSGKLAGQVLNLASSNNRTTVVAQGSLGGYLMLAQENGTANHRIFQLRTSGGVSAFDIVADNLAAIVPNVLNFNMTNGFIGVGTAAVSTKPLAMKSGAYCTTGGVWTNASSREFKQDIEPLTIEQARETVQALNPVGYRYKDEPDEQYVGFIAEDVPELVATNDRKSLAPMDITAVLTKVVQDQDAQIKAQQKQLDELSEYKTLVSELAKEVKELRQLVAQRSTN